MKRIISVLIICLCILTLTGCKKEEEVVVEPMITGGWSEEEMELNDELIAIFESATSELVGVGYTPIKLLGTQVVAGTNYRFLAEATTVTAQPVTSLKVVTVYEDLEGNTEVLSVEDYIVEPEIVGGWSYEEEEMNEQLMAVFLSATENLDGVGYTPIRLLARQVVAGTNYKFLVEATVITQEAATSYKVMTIYEDPQGNSEITSIEDYAELNSPQMVGGFTEQEQELNDDLRAIFNEAMEGLDGVGYVPIKLLGTQVVAGTNYKFLAEATTVTAESSSSYKVVVIYKDLEGAVSILSIEDYTE